MVVHTISLGAGVQSSTMALMAAAGEITPMPAAAIFADTQAESHNRRRSSGSASRQGNSPASAAVDGARLSKAEVEGAMKFTTGMCPKHFKRRNGRLMRRGQMDKQHLRYYRGSRKLVMVQSIVSYGVEAQHRFQEYMNLISDHMMSVSTLPESWKLRESWKTR